ncbi:glutamate-ammonia-ligase adenylyltransferase [bacterium]|nr:glutamate-ammonia-ligase adenylyltransferase [bacterium]
MEADSPYTDDAALNWLDVARFSDPVQAKRDLRAIWNSGASPALLRSLRLGLTSHLDQLDDLDETISHLSRFIDSSSDPISLLALFARDSEALPALLQVFATSKTLANRLISDPASFDLIRASDEKPASREMLINELLTELQDIEQPNRAALAIRRFSSREMIRIAYGEFVRGATPERVGRQISNVTDAVIEAGLNFSLQRLAKRRGMPQRPDGTTPELTVIGLGHLGGEEMGYGSSIKLVFLYDSIDNQNVWHRDFYSTVVHELLTLLRGDESRSDGMDIDLREGPRYEVGVQICSFREALRIYETAGRTWQRLSFVKARVVAGSQKLGKTFLSRLEPWVYRRFMSRVEIAEIRTLRNKLEKSLTQNSDLREDIGRSPGGRDDLELTVEFLQLLHGGNLGTVRCRNTYDAIFSLEQAGCLTHQEATLLSENYARLCRLQHQLSVMFDQSSSLLPSDISARKRLAWQLGIRAANGSGGDIERFEALLHDTFDKNRRMINHLMLDAPGDGDSVASETELLLDPNPHPTLVESTLSKHGLVNPQRAMENLAALSTESVPFLSPHRCRHFLTSIAPALLTEVSRTPDPDATLASLVEVTDSLGAKATLWELLGSSHPTMELMVRLCATTPYLRGILTNNPGMIDELIDSLLLNRMPSAQRLDAHSIAVCRGASDIERILWTFKNSAHLNIGVRDMLGKDTLEATHQSIGDTAESCVRRMIEHEQEALANQYGDPCDDEGNPAELITFGLGKLGGREPNYHSDLDAIFLYSDNGETQRRMGGRRATLTNQQFFNQLTQRVITRINQPSPDGRLYELDSRLRDTGEEGVWAMTLKEFGQRFRENTAPLWQRLALCKARAISGSRDLRHQADETIATIIRNTEWKPEMAIEIREMRERMQQTATQTNLKRGAGGTVDIEFVSQMLTLRHANASPEVLQTGTTASLLALADAGYLSDHESMTLVNGYRTLRRIEANLRLMNTTARHELPEDENSMKNLAFLMNETDPEMIVAQCVQTRHNNRLVFHQIFDRASSLA